jgi:hypothetical protein
MCLKIAHDPLVEHADIGGSLGWAREAEQGAAVVGLELDDAAAA